MHKVTRKFLPIALAGSIVSMAIPVAVAADTWEVTLTPYAWLAGVDGDIKQNGEEFSVSASFSDIMDNLDVGGALMFEANRGLWVNMIQVDYASMKYDDVEVPLSSEQAHLTSDDTFAVAGTGCRIPAGERATVDVLLGVRYIKIDNTFDPPNKQRLNADKDIYDGVVMVRPRMPLGQHWVFSPTLSVGAGDSDLVYELSPQFYYEFSSTQLRLGYRSLAYDFEDGDEKLDITFSGPFLGVGFTF